MKYVGAANVWNSDGASPPSLAVKSLSGSVPRYLVRMPRLRTEKTRLAERARVRVSHCSGSVTDAESSRQRMNPPGWKKPSSVFDGSVSVACTMACSWNDAFGFIKPLQFCRLTQRM